MSRPRSKLDALGKEERLELIKKLHTRQDGICYICDHTISLQLDEVDIDHIVPISPPFNGIDDEQNWGLVHRKENESKSNRSLQLMRYIYKYKGLRGAYVEQKEISQ
jgi:CRISPR/Cas system Type II protein with McrA/HNH and RuvC-like nuclease domain